MRVTNVRVDSFTPKGTGKKGVCAKVTVIFDDVFAVHNISVLNGDKGLYVAYPGTGDILIKNGKRHYEDVAHPLCNSLSKELKDAVLLAYEKYRLSLIDLQ